MEKREDAGETADMSNLESKRFPSVAVEADKVKGGTWEAGRIQGDMESRSRGTDEVHGYPVQRMSKVGFKTLVGAG